MSSVKDARRVRGPDATMRGCTTNPIFNCEGDPPADSGTNPLRRMSELETTHLVDAHGDALSMLKREWLLTNGTGAYAMGTVPAINTRRYHGLFVAAVHPPVGRVIAVNQTLETLVREDRDTHKSFTSCHFLDDRGADVLEPGGAARLRHFQRGTCVVWEYADGPLTFTRQLALHWRQQAATLSYQVEGLDGPAVLSIGPMLTVRDFHGLIRRGTAGPMTVEPAGYHVKVRGGAAVITMSCRGARFVHDADWWHDLYYASDAERGQEHREDVFVPGRFEVDLQDRGPTVVHLTIALGDSPVEPCSTTDQRREHLAPAVSFMSHVVDNDRMRSILAIAADDFVVQRHVQDQALCTILAGYPWFADWGRDTFIALPGLLLCTGRFTEARATLRAFAAAIRDGLVPNRFDDYDEHVAHHNTVDASLWFIHAAVVYVQAAGDRASWDDWLGPAVRQVIEAYRRGTPPALPAAERIRMDTDGLITAGSSRTQLTWMDAARDGVVFTPRHGKAVEINALWHHALLATADLTARHDRLEAQRLRELAGRARRAFNSVFWDERRGHLVDHVHADDSGRPCADRALRPNQIFALSLPHSPLSADRQRRVLNVVKRQLLTPFGLRSLSQDDPNYQGHYGGPPFDRDKAYHQGTVWPWLIGPYAEAVLRVGNFGPPARSEAAHALAPLLNRLLDDGLGQLNEIHEGEAPHRPVGCIAQAWSVAEVLRVLTLIAQAGSMKSMVPASGTRPAEAASERN